MVVVTRFDLSDVQRRAISLLLGKHSEAGHAESKSFIEAIIQAELYGAVADYNAAFPTMPTAENTGSDIGTVRTNGDIQTRPIYSLRQIESGKYFGLVEVEIKTGSGFKKIRVKPAAITLHKESYFFKGGE